MTQSGDRQIKGGSSNPPRSESSPIRSELPVSALIITKNEEKNIERCLESLSWAKEIVVVDAESSDRTKEICEASDRPWSSKIKFLSRKWTGFKDQRTFAMEHAHNEWLFVIDADEKCSEELSEKFQNMFQSGPDHKAYKIRRVEYFLGKPIRHGIWNPSYQDRFFLKHGVKYVNDIHEYPIFPTPPQEIHEPIIHSPSFSPEQFLYKMNKYTSIEARDRVRNGQRTNLIHLLFSGPAMFLKNYFYYGAYKDGKHGLIISLLEGVSRVVRHVKIWQYTRELDKE